jgi:hypothetical protein
MMNIQTLKLTAVAMSVSGSSLPQRPAAATERQRSAPYLCEFFVATDV